MTDIKAYCFYCRKVTKTDHMTIEMNKTDDFQYLMTNLIKCSECKKTTVFTTDGKIQLIKEEQQ